MVAVLSRIFGPAHLELIEDAIQDTFINATVRWRNEIPENPEAWLTKAAKNRAIDLIRQINALQDRHEKTIHGSATIELGEYFLDHEVQDSQLRMIFLACHPHFSKEEQIAFALKSISGFSLREISAALLQKEETIKKRLARAKKKIRKEGIRLEYPRPDEIQSRLSGVLHIIYLIFNEGFHSTKKEALLDRELCGEALRLCRNLLAKPNFRSGSLYALFALLCYHSARIDAKTIEGKVIDLEAQDRSTWYQPLIHLGHQSLQKTAEYPDQSVYHLEADIAKEHVIADHFEKTNWANILKLYQEMYRMAPSDTILLSMASVFIYLGELNTAAQTLRRIDSEALNKRKYLYHGTWAKIHEKQKAFDKALSEINLSIGLCSNELEKNYLIRKRERLLAAMY